MTYINRFIALSCVAASVLATSCVNEFEEGQAPVSGEGYYISLTGDVNEGGVESRAHWDINSNDQSLAFTWDASDNEMKSFVWSNNAFIDFDGSKKYSATTVTPNAENKKQAQLQITTGLSRKYAEGDRIWAVSPLEDSNISADNKVTFTLPDQFVQTELNSTEHLKDHILMSGTGTVSAANTASISFKVLPAIYRFKIINNESEELTVNEVSISGPFCNEAELSMDNGTVTPAYSVSNGTYAIKVTTPDEGLTVAANTTAYLYALVFPTNTSSISDNITLSFKGNYGDTSADYTKTAPCKNLYYNNINSNTYYDLEVPVSNPAYNDIFSFTADDNLKSLGYGQSYQIKYTADEGATITWLSNSDIVSVDNNGILKVKTLVGGDATITASVTKGGVSFTKTVDVTVAQGRFDFSFGEGLSPWYVDTSGASEGGHSDGKTTVNMASVTQKDGSFKYRGDIRLVNKKDLCIDAQSYPILAVKITAPDAWTKNSNGNGCLKLEIHDSTTNTYGLYRGDNGDKNGNNTFTLLKPESITVGQPVWVYFDLRLDFQYGNKLPLEPAIFQQLKFIIADNVDMDTYDIYWVKSFASVEELTDYVNSETASK